MAKITMLGVLQWTVKTDVSRARPDRALAALVTRSNASLQVLSLAHVYRQVLTRIGDALRPHVVTGHRR